MTKTIEVTQYVTVTVPDDLLTEEFMAEFREHFYDFTTVDEHLYHLAQLRARGIYDSDSFIEGYGNAKELGIKLEVE